MGFFEAADDKKKDVRIVFMDVKKGAGSLTRTQRAIRQAVIDKAVAWQTVKIVDE